MGEGIRRVELDQAERLKEVKKENSKLKLSARPVTGQKKRRGISRWIMREKRGIRPQSVVLDSPPGGTAS
jgi:hypothetical protein